MDITIRRIGNSKGVVLPKPLLEQVGLHDVRQASVTVEDGAIVLRKREAATRAGWADAAQALAERGDEVLLMGEFDAAADEDFVW